MILFYTDGNIKRVRIDLPKLPDQAAQWELAMTMLATPHVFDDKVLGCKVDYSLVPNKDTYSLLTFQDGRLWLTVNQ